MWIPAVILLLLTLWRVFSFASDFAELQVAAKLARACVVGLCVGCIAFPNEFRTATVQFLDQKTRPIVKSIQDSIRPLTTTTTTTTTTEKP